MVSELIGALKVSKSIGLAYSWKEIYVSNLQKVLTETRLEDVLLRSFFVIYGAWKSKPRLKSELCKQQ